MANNSKPYDLMASSDLSWLHELSNWLDHDIYSTAWVGMVPALANPKLPAWPETLEFIRSQQLPDGGWGDPRTYFAHGRLIATLAAIKALHLWRTDDGDYERIQAGLEAVNRYTLDLSKEPHEPIGFEILLPRLVHDLSALLDGTLLKHHWEQFEPLYQQKLRKISDLRFDPNEPRTWWFSMEMIPEYQLSLLDDSILLANGSVATSTATTAAYLRAQRVAGRNSPAAARYLAEVIKIGNGAVPFCYPVQTFERAWIIDALRRAGLPPTHPVIADMLDEIERNWYQGKHGLSYSTDFLLNDGDCTSLGFAVLSWANRNPADDPLLSFWNGEYFYTYLDERGHSLSANIHALTALRIQPGFPHRAIATQLTKWLRSQIKPHVVFDDKWHLSPFYSISRALEAVAGLDDEIALRCLNQILSSQHPDGGWGWNWASTLEETAYCTLALTHALRIGLLSDKSVLEKAAAFFRSKDGHEPLERLWIGKDLYRPAKIVGAAVFAAQLALTQSTHTAGV